MLEVVRHNNQSVQRAYGVVNEGHTSKELAPQ